MSDINTSTWTTFDAGNVAPAPDGIQGSYAPATITSIIQTIRGAVKREYVTTNPTVTATGSAGAYAITFDLMPTLDLGKRVSFWSNHTNTGAASVNINTNGGISIRDDVGQPLVGSEIKSGAVVDLVYDGTNFRLLNPDPESETYAGTITANRIVSTTTVEGNGSLLTNLDASKLTSGVVPNARISGDYDGFGIITANKLSLKNSTRVTDIDHTTDGTIITNSTATGGATRVVMKNTGGIDSLTFGVGTDPEKIVYHEGNLTPARVIERLGYTPVNNTVQIFAGLGMTGGGSLIQNRMISLGTPSTISRTSTNNIASGTHSHELSLTKQDLLDILGYDPVNHVGSVLTMSGTTPPDGYLLANGAAVTTAYPALRAYYLAHTDWPKNANGDPLLPDYRGLFLRGWGSGQSRDPGRVFGAVQDDAFQSHRHNQMGVNTLPLQGGSTAAAADGAFQVPRGQTSNPITDGVNGTPRTANETRPINLTVTYWIKT